VLARRWRLKPSVGLGRWDSPSKWKPLDCNLFFWLDVRAGSVGEVCGTFQAVANVYTGRENFHASRRWALDRIEASASMDGRSGSLLTPMILCVGSFSIGRKCNGEGRC